MRSGGRRLTTALAIGACTLVAIAAGCGGDDDDSAAEPPPATTAPATTAPATTAPATTAPQTTATAPVAGGDAAAGKVIFQKTCSGCHADLGNQAGVGPKLAGVGLTAEVVRTTVVNGKSPMPAGLVTGQDLDDVVAYVVSLQ